MHVYIHHFKVGIEPEDVNAEVLPSHKRNQVMDYQKGKTKVQGMAFTIHEITDRILLLVGNCSLTKQN